MAKPAIYVKGLAEFQRELRRLGLEMPRELRAANKEAAEIVAKEAKRRAPVLKTQPGPTSGRPGALRDSIKAQASGRTAYVKAGTGKRIVYAPIQEFGWPGHNIRPQPYIYPAIASKSKEVIETYGEMLDDIAKRAFPD